MKPPVQRGSERQMRTMDLDAPIRKIHNKYTKRKHTITTFRRIRGQLSAQCHKRPRLAVCRKFAQDGLSGWLKECLLKLSPRYVENWRTHIRQKLIQWR